MDSWGYDLHGPGSMKLLTRRQDNRTRSPAHAGGHVRKAASCRRISPSLRRGGITLFSCLGSVSPYWPEKSHMSLNLYMTVASLQANISDQVTGTNDSEIKNETVLQAVLASLDRSKKAGFSAKKAERIVAELFGIENSMQNHANTKFNEMIAEVKKLHTRSRPRWRPKPRLRPRFRKPAEPRKTVADFVQAVECQNRSNLHTNIYRLR